MRPFTALRVTSLSINFINSNFFDIFVNYKVLITKILPEIRKGK
jgi:hypothetical protein